MLNQGSDTFLSNNLYFVCCPNIDEIIYSTNNCTDLTHIWRDAHFNKTFMNAYVATVAPSSCESWTVVGDVGSVPSTCMVIILIILLLLAFLVLLLADSDRLLFIKILRTFDFWFIFAQIVAMFSIDIASNWGGPPRSIAYSLLVSMFQSMACIYIGLCLMMDSLVFTNIG